MPDWSVELHPACERWADGLNQADAEALPDLERESILLVGGDKSDDWKGWYEANIPVAADRFDEHQARLTEKRTKKPAAKTSKSNKKDKGNRQ